jgi:5-methylcytosine-specific restriction endonuclease McrA
MDDTSIPELSPEERAAQKKEEKRIYNQAWQAAHPGYASRKSRQWREQHPEEAQAYDTHYKETHRAERCAATRLYEQSHPEQTAAAKKAWAARNKLLLQERRRQRHARNLARNRLLLQAWRKKNPAKVRAILQRQRARKANAPINDFTDAEWESLCKAVGFRCCYCGEKFTFKELTPDHLTPYEKQGSNTLHNILPCCGSCNSRKQHRAVLKPVQPFLLLPDEDV